MHSNRTFCCFDRNHGVLFVGAAGSSILHGWQTAVQRKERFAVVEREEFLCLFKPAILFEKRSRFASYWLILIPKLFFIISAFYMCNFFK